MDSVILIPVAWFAVALVCVGIGAIAFNCWATEVWKPSADAVADSFWLGWSLLLIVLPLWHLWLPIDGRFWIAAVPVGLLGWIRFGPRWSSETQARLFARSSTLIVLVLALLWSMREGLIPLSVIPDTGLYHLATIRWENTFAAVPGLGNLHGRLAFNSGDFLYIAAMNLGPLAGKGWYAANSLLSAVLFMQLVVGGARVVRGWGKTSAEPVDVFRLLMIAPFLMVNCADTGTANDLAVAVMQIVTMSSCIQVLTRLQRREPTSAARIWQLAILCAAGVVIKLSFAAIGVTILFVVLVSLARQRAWGRQTLPRIATIVGTFLIGIVPWMVHGIVLSGYPLFPTTILPIPVSWRVPSAQATSDRTDITAYARLPGAAYRSSLGNWHWLGPWVRRIYRAIAPPLLLLVVFAFPFWYKAGVRNSKWQQWLVLSLLPPAVAVCVWFVEAPEPRFAGVLLWMIPACLVVISTQAQSLRRSSTAILLFLAVAGLSCVLNHSVESSLKDIVKHPLRGFTAPPQVPLKVLTTESGLRVFIPVQGDEGWDAPLPETPYFNRLLRLRCANNLGCGFTQ